MTTGRIFGPTTFNWVGGLQGKYKVVHKTRVTVNVPVPGTQQRLDVSLGIFTSTGSSTATQIYKNGASCGVGTKKWQSVVNVKCTAALGLGLRAATVDATNCKVTLALEGKDACMPSSLPCQP